MDDTIPPSRKRGEARPVPRLRPRSWEAPVPEPESVRATEDASTAAREVGALLRAARGTSWYVPGSAVDRAAVALCRLRRAEAGVGRRIERGDEAVRTALSRATKEELVWLASRTVSYLDETGFPEALEAPLTRRPARDQPSG